MKALKQHILFKSPSGNGYIYDLISRKILLAHPVLYFLLEKYQKTGDLKPWFEGLTGDSISAFDTDVPRTVVSYYYEKLSFLIANGVLREDRKSNNLNGRVETHEIEKILANVKQVTLEVTDSCNLACEYCGYGKFYNDYDKRENTKMNPTIAKKLLKYLLKFWNSPFNKSQDRSIYIGFYGGEPLLNPLFIQEVVGFVKNLNARHNRFRFAMTTNGVLLERNIDFLVENNFSLLISLDGNRINNGYRVFKDGGSPYDIIVKNALAIQKKYPEYFREKINFNAVLHNRNSVSDIFNYFEEKFDKVPRISELNTSGIESSQKEAFWKTYSNINQSLYESEDYTAIEKKMFVSLSSVQSIGNFLNKHSGYSYKDYNNLLFSSEVQQRTPTGTCFPFSKKVFLTVKGKVLPCERIGQQYALGHVDDNQVFLDPKRIADVYNRYYAKMKSKCSHCYNLSTCTQCLFYLNIEDEKPICNGFMTRKEFSEYLSTHIYSLEQNPELYSKLMREVVIDK